VLMVAAGRMVEVAQKSALDLAEKGVSVGVVNARWVKPLDPRIATWAADVSQVVTLEDGVVTGGFGSGVMELFAGSGVAKPVTMIGVPDRFLPFGSPADLHVASGMDPDSVTQTVLSLLK